MRPGRRGDEDRGSGGPGHWRRPRAGPGRCPGTGQRRRAEYPFGHQVATQLAEHDGREQFLAGIDLVPGLPLLKEWAYAGAFFTYTGAMVSHLTTGYDVGEVVLLAVMTVLTVLSWALRPASRRTGSGWRRGPGDGSPAARSPQRSLSHFFTGGGSPGAM